METKQQNYYTILNVNRHSTSDEIKQQYTRLAIIVYLGGVNANTEIRKESLHILNEAYEVLSNPLKRHEYDKSLFRSNDYTYLPPVNKSHTISSMNAFDDGISHSVAKLTNNPNEYLQHVQNSTYNTWYGGLTSRRYRLYLFIVVFMIIRFCIYINNLQTNRNALASLNSSPILIGNNVKSSNE